MRLGIVNFIGYDAAGENNSLIAQTQYPEVLTVASIDANDPQNYEIMQLLNVTAPTTLFINWTNNDFTQFNTIGRIVGVARLEQIQAAIDYILDNEAAVDAAQGDTAGDILGAWNGSGMDISSNTGGSNGQGNGQGSGGFGLGWFNINIPWWLWGGIAITAGYKTSRADTDNEKIMWGAGTVFSVLTAVSLAQK